MARFPVSVDRVNKHGVTSVARPTALGNPFRMYTESQRDEVCDKYQAWFNDKVSEKDPSVITQLKELWLLGQQQGYLKLGCHCSPRRCHADTIASYLESRMD